MSGLSWLGYEEVQERSAWNHGSFAVMFMQRLIGRRLW